MKVADTVANHRIILITDTFVLIEDLNTGRSVTNDAHNVVISVDREITGGLAQRHLYYRDSTGRYDELRHLDGRFVSFGPCSTQQQQFLSKFSHKD